MLKTLLTPACAMALLFAGSTVLTAQKDSKSAAQSSQEQKDTSKTVTKDGTTKTNTETVYGKVESFEPGKSIKVSVPGTLVTTKSFDLSGKDVTSKVASGIKVGDWVRVREKTDNNGHKTVTVDHSSEKRNKS
jgi:FKBP-type peptidyl-prolyl cis-trans isomerase